MILAEKSSRILKFGPRFVDDLIDYLVIHLRSLHADDIFRLVLLTLCTIRHRRQNRPPKFLLTFIN